MPILALEAPSGAEAEFALLFAVVLLGPIVVQRLGIPGIIGLLLGGFAIGPHGLGLIGAGNQTIPELGQLGLLYLMFVAGLELDLSLLREYRRAAVTFGVLTFLVPFALGVAVGLQQGWETPAALLLGSLLASHTLLLYPTVRDAGKGGNPAVASAVGATVLTDTLALVVLAGVAGTSTGDGSTAEVLGEVAIGLVVLVAVGLLVLPKVALWALKVWGGDRAARYLVSILSFLGMAVLADVFGIEGIVGAFFAGLALNKLVPNHGPSMERIEFFGSAVFIPIFLVSVGLLLDPSVMFTAETLGMASLLCLACIGGKGIAAAVARPLLGFSRSEVMVMFVLTTPQAAATLAATLVGFEIGLFGTSVVNAVLVLILVSILVATLLASRVLPHLPLPPARVGALGERVLVAVGADGPSDGVVATAEAIASSDGGSVDLVFVRLEGEDRPTPAFLRTVEANVFRGALDGEVRTAVDRTIADAVGHAVLTHTPTVVLLDEGSLPVDTPWAPMAAYLDGVAAVAVTGDGGRLPGRAVLVTSEADSSATADQVAQAVGRGTVDRVEAADAVEGSSAGCVVVPVADWADLAVLAPMTDGLRLAVIGRGGL